MCITGITKEQSKKNKLLVVHILTVGIVYLHLVTN